MERIAKLDNEVEARILGAELSAQDIPHVIQSYHDSAYDGLWAFQQGWGFIEAPPEYRDEIIMIFEDLKKQQDQ